MHMFKKLGLPWCLRCKESICNADLGSVRETRRFSGEENGYPLQYYKRYFE